MNCCAAAAKGPRRTTVGVGYNGARLRALRRYRMDVVVMAMMSVMVVSSLGWRDEKRTQQDDRCDDAH